MLYAVTMHVELPPGMPLEEREQLIAHEKEYAQELQRAGEWRHLWRVVGKYANLSMFDVADHDRLHVLLSGLPLYPHMRIDVVPLAAHPSAIREGAS